MGSCRECFCCLFPSINKEEDSLPPLSSSDSEEGRRPTDSQINCNPVKAQHEQTRGFLSLQSKSSVNLTPFFFLFWNAVNLTLE